MANSPLERQPSCFECSSPQYAISERSSFIFLIFLNFLTLLDLLRRCLNMNTLFGRDVRNKNPTPHDSMMKMMRSQIINEELIDHRNWTSMGLQPP